MAGINDLARENWATCSDAGYLRQRKRKSAIPEEFRGLLQGVPSDKH